MAKIRPYESQVNPGGEIPTAGASLSEVGGPGAVALGQSIVNAGYSGAHAYQIIQANEDAAAVSAAHVKLAQIQASETQRFADFTTNADPADPNPWETFRTGVPYDIANPPDAPAGGGRIPAGASPRVDSLQAKLDALKTETQNPMAQRMVAQGAAQVSQHFLDKTVVLSGQLAGIQAKNQLNTYIDAQGTRVQTDPTEFYGPTGALAQTKQYFETAFPKMSVAWRDEMYQNSKNKLAFNMVRGMLNDPGSGQMVKARLERGDYDGLLTDDAKIQLHSQAQTNINAWETEQRRVEAEALRQQKQTYEATGRTLTSRFLQHEDSPTNPMTPPLKATDVATEMLNNRLDDNTGRALFGLIDSHSKAATLKNDEDVSATLLRNIYRPYGDPKKIVDEVPLINAATNKKITPSRMKFLRDEFEKARTDEGMTLGKSRETFLATRKSSITQSNPLLGKMDQEGDINFGRLSEFAAGEEARMRKANKNPHDLYDEKSADYLGNRLSTFQKTLTESIRDTAEKYKKAPGLPKTPQGGTPDHLKRLPGESIQDYDKRTGK